MDDAKLLDYVLNPRHPIGRHHALLFERLLGINRENANTLRDALLAAAHSDDVVEEQKTAYGTKYKMHVTLNSPRGTRTVMAVWITEHGQDRPRLVTCFVE